MVGKDKQHAVFALHRVLVAARMMAYEKVAHHTLADVLDVVEYLPRLLADERDKTSAYRDQLVLITGQHSLLGGVVACFDREPLPSPW